MSEASKSADSYDNDRTNQRLSNSNESGKCEAPSELMNYRDMMLKNQFDLKKKEEEVQEYARKLTKIKSKVKSSRHSSDSTSKVDDSISDDSILDISDAKTPSEKGLLLKKKVEENRKIFELRNKELNESKRAAEVKVEKILQQLDASSTAINSNQQSLVGYLNDDKDKKINDLNNRIIELESIIIDLKDNLSNKDSVIESKTKAITLVTDKLSQKSKVTLDNLEDTKDEMRHMQEKFIKIEAEMKNRIDSLLSEVQTKDSTLLEFDNKLKIISIENEELKAKFDSLISEKDQKISELEVKFKSEEEFNILMNEKDNQIAKLQHDIQELNHNLIKVKAQNKSKLKNLQKRLDSYYKASSSNEQGVNFVNQVAMLEEEIGNLQLNLVDFDEMKVTNEDLKRQISTLNEQLSSKTEEINSYNNAIVALENQKLELIQELHEVKQEVLALESENADCENQRVTAELKVVELEEKLELLHKQDYRKDVISDVTQNDAELITILRELQHHVNSVLNEKCALNDKFNNLRIYLDNSNEVLRHLKSEIIHVKQSISQQHQLLEVIVSNLMENQLESIQEEQLTYLLSNNQDFINKSSNLHAKVDEMITSIDDVRKQCEELTNDKNQWDHKLLFRDIDTSDIDALANVNIVNLLINNNLVAIKSDDNRIEEDSSIITKILETEYDEDVDKLHSMIHRLNNIFKQLYNLLNNDRVIIEEIIKNYDLNGKHIDNGKHLVAQLVERLEENRLFDNRERDETDDRLSIEEINLHSDILDDSDVSKMLSVEDRGSTTLEKSNKSLMDELTNQLDSLQNNILEKRQHLTSLLSDSRSVINLEFNENNKLKIMDALNEQLEVVDKKLKESRNLVDKDENEENYVKIDKLTKDVNNLRQSIVENEQKINLILKAKRISASQIDASNKKQSSNENIQDQIDKLSSEMQEKDSKITAIAQDKPVLEKQVKEREDMIQKNLQRIVQLTNEVDDMKEEVERLEGNLALAEDDNNVLRDNTELNDEDLRNQLEELNREAENKAELIRSLEQEKMSLENLMEEKVKLNDKSIEKINKLSEESTILQETILEHEYRFSEILNEKENLQDKIQVRADKLEVNDELKNQKEQLLSKVEVQESVIQSISHDKLNLENQLKEKVALIENTLLKVDKLVTVMSYLKQKIAEHELNFTIIMKDKNLLEDEMKVKDDKLKLLGELRNKNDELFNEAKNNDNITELIWKEKAILESQLREKEDLNEESNSKISGLSDEITMLRKKIDEHEKKDDELKSVKELHNQIEQLSMEIEQKENLMKSILQEKSILEAQLQEKEELHQNIVVKFNDLTNENETLKQQVAEHEQTFKALEEDQRVLEDEIKLKIENLQTLQVEVEKSSNEVASKNNTIESILNEKALLEEQLLDKEQLNHYNMEKINEFEKEITDLKENIAAHERNLVLVVKEKESLENQVKVEEEKLQSMNELNSQNQHLRNEINSKVELIESISREKTVLEDQLREIEKVNEDGAQKVDELYNEISALKQKLTEYEYEISQKNGELELRDDLYKQVEKLTIELSVKEKMIDDISQKKTELENQFIQKEELHQQALLQNNLLSEEVQLLNKQLSDYDQRYMAIINDKNSLEAELQKNELIIQSVDYLKENIKDLNNQLFEKQALTESIVNDKIDLDKRLDEITKIYQDSESNNNSLMKEVEILNRKVIEYNGNLQAALNEKQMLEEEINIRDEKLTATSELYNQIQNLKSIIEDKNNYVELLISEKDELQNQLLEKGKFNEESLARINELMMNENSLKDKLLEFEENVALALSDKEKMEDKIKMRDELKLTLITELQEEIDRLNEDVASKESMIKSTLEDKEKLENQLTEKEELNQTSLFKINQLTSEVNVLRLEIGEYERNYSAVLSEKEYFEDLFTVKDEKLKAVKADLRKEIQELKDELEHRETAIASISAEKALLENQLVEKRKFQKECMSKIDQLMSEEEHLNERIIELEDRIVEIAREKRVLEDQMKKKDEEYRLIFEKQIEMSKEYEIAQSKQLSLEKMMEEKNLNAEKLQKKSHSSQESIDKIAELRKEIDNLNAEVLRRQRNIILLLDNMIILEHELQQSRGGWSDNQRKLEINDKLKLELENHVEYAKKLKSEIEGSQEETVASRLKCVAILEALNKEFESAIQEEDNVYSESEESNVIIADTDAMTKLAQELENVKKQNVQQIQKMKVIAANLKKKTAQCHEYEMSVKDLREKWVTEVSEKNMLNSELEALKTKLINFEFNNGNQQASNEFIDVSQISAAKYEFLAELEKLKNEQLMEEKLKIIEALKLQYKNIFGESELECLLESFDIVYNNKEEMLNLVSSKLIDLQEISKSDFKHLISKMAEKYAAVETLKLENRKLVEALNPQSTSEPVADEETKDEALVLSEEPEVKAEDSEEFQCQSQEKSNQSAITLDEEDVWGWNEQNSEVAEFKMSSICTPQTQMEIKIAELEDKINDLNDKKSAVDEELKAMQLKNKQLVKKLKEYKIQTDNLQQQVKLQSNSGNFGDLDFTIEEELKGQISQLEKSVSNFKEENEKLVDEKNGLLKKIEILVTTKEELTKTMTMKNNELMMQIKNMGQNTQSRENVQKNSENVIAGMAEFIKCNEKISQLEKDLNALSSENDELRELSASYKIEVENKQKEISELKNDMSYSKLSFCNMGQASENQESFDELSDKNARNEQIIAELQAHLNQVMSENIQRKMTIDSYVELEKQMRAQIQSYLEAFTQKDEEAYQLRNYIENTESIVSDQKARCERIEEEYNDIRKQFRAKTEEAEELSIRFNEILDEKYEQINSLEDQIKSLKDQIDDLNREIREITDNYYDLKLANDADIENYTELQVKYEKVSNELTSQAEQFNAELLEKESKIRHLEEDLKQTLESLASKTEELNKLKLTTEDNLNAVQIPTIEAFFSTQVPQSQTFQSQQPEVSAESKDLQSQVSEEHSMKSTKEQENLNKSYEDLQRRLIEVNESVTNVTELLNIRVQEVADLKQYIKKLEFDKLAVDNANNELSNTNSKLNEKNEEIGTRLNQVKEELEERNQIVLNLESKVMEVQGLYDSTISDLKLTISSNEAQIENLRSSIAEKDTQISNLQAELLDGHNKVNELTRIIGELDNSTMSSEILNEKVEEIQKLEDAIERLKNEHSIEVKDYARKLNENETMLNELKNNLSLKNEENEDLKYILNDNPYPAIIQELQDKIDSLYKERHQLQLPMADSGNVPSSEVIINESNSSYDDTNESKDSNASELDVALYMLHQRDVRCEELTHELLQLIEERDTLQLRLSNAIKINEELKKCTPSTSTVLSENIESLSSEEATGSSTTVAKSVDIDKDVNLLNEKLSQLHNVNYQRDIRLIDDRESRHQQMSVMNKSTLNPISPDAAAKLIDAKYTVSRDVQSQSNVLLNWFWGKSTPKVTHM